MIEVEERSLLTKQQYEELISYFRKENINEKEEKQVTTYFSCEQDFRLMETDQGYLRLWLKKGEMHESYREEVEVLIEDSQKENIKRLFFELGYEEKVKWYRTRKLYQYLDMTITLDYSVGYGYILEIEKLIEQEEEIQKAKEQIKKVFYDFDIKITSKEIFKEKYKDYLENWKEYTKRKAE